MRNIAVNNFTPNKMNYEFVVNVMRARITFKWESLKIRPQEISYIVYCKNIIYIVQYILYQL